MNYIKQKLIIVFIIGWIAYASTYFLRKPLGVIKSDIESELKFSKSQLGIFDSALLLPYALVQVNLFSQRIICTLYLYFDFKDVFWTHG